MMHPTFPISPKTAASTPEIDPKTGQPVAAKAKEETSGQKAVKWVGYTVAIVVIATAALVIVELIYKVCLVAREWWTGKKVQGENQFTRLLFAPLIDKVRQFTSVAPMDIIERLDLTNKDEQQLIQYLQNNFEISTTQMQEILKGAHVHLKDGGKAYFHWLKEVKNKHTRVSSHPASDKQFAVRGEFVKELLFSKLDDCTWFQLEGSPVSFGNVTTHMIDYFKYKITGRNQGPYGSSKYTHNDPLILTPKYTPSFQPEV